MEKINLVELLKDCPSGMELNCTMYDNLYFDKVVEEYKYPIGCYTIYDGCRTSVNFTEFGEFNNYGTAKCVIFPKDRTTWEGFIPPYKFKDGDVIIKNNFIAIISYIESSGRIWYHCWYDKKYKECKIKTDYGIGCINDGDEIRFATEEEKQKLFNAIQDKGCKWNSETKTLEKLIEPKFKVGDKIANDDYVVEITEIDSENEVYIYESKVGGIGCILFSEQDDWELVRNKFDINTLKPFDKVLVKYGNVTDWKAEIYSHYDEGMTNSPFCCIGAWYERCIPYEGNEHLLGTSDECDEYYKNWK